MPDVYQLTSAMISLYHGDPKRIQHFMKVFSYAHMIALEEQVGIKQREVIEVAALVHDIGIHAAEKKYHSTAGEYQEELGPPLAKTMLEALDYSPSFIQRVCWLVGHHHTYIGITDIDLQILVEADFLVNAFEDNMNKRNIMRFRDQVFRTETGTNFLNEMFDLL